MVQLSPGSARRREQVGAQESLGHRVALVTGAGRRIGHVIALALARAGAHVVVNYNTSKTEALATAEEIRQTGVKALAARADVSQLSQVRRMFDQVARNFGRLDILVNNAAIFNQARWDKLNNKDWDRMLGVNLKGTFFCAQFAARMMLDGAGGDIINLASLGGLQAWPSYMHYCASKAGVIMLTQCLAKALAPRIRVNAIAPGTIAFPGEERQRRFQQSARSTPLKKLGRAEDIADLAVFLASRNHYMTGKVFAVDGGKSIP